MGQSPLFSPNVKEECCDDGQCNFSISISFSSFWGLSFFPSLYVIIAIGRCVPLPPWLLFLSLPLCLLSLLQEDVCHCNPSLSFFLSLFVYHCCYRKVCAIVTSVHLSFLFIVVVIRRCAPSDLDSCLFFSLFVFVGTRRCVQSQPWLVYFSLLFCFIVIVIERCAPSRPWIL